MNSGASGAVAILLPLLQAGLSKGLRIEWISEQCGVESGAAPHEAS